MFERFTERARQVIVLAQEEARSLNHQYIGTEHILLGLLREREGLAARVLFDYLSASEARDLLERKVGIGKGAVTQPQIPFTPRGKKVLELALREALSLGHNYIGTEHILLALNREEDGVAKAILDNFVGQEEIRDGVLSALSGPGSRRAEKEQLAEDRKKREWETQRKTEEENSSDDSQNDSESNPEKVRATITYGNLTLTIEGDTSGLSSTQISQLLAYGSRIFKK